MGMEDVLSDTQEEVVQETPPEEPKKEAEPLKEEPKVEPIKEQPKEIPFTEREKAFLRKAEEERSKRQEIERRYSQQPPAPQQPPQTFWEAPEENLKSFEEKIRTELTRGRIQTSEIVARSKYKDFDEAVESFSKIVEDTPGMFQQWVQSPDPAEFVYKTYRSEKMQREYGDPGKMREQLRQEVRAEIEAELKAKADKLTQEKEAIPGSLSEVRGTPSGSKAVWTGPTPLGDILAR